MTSDDNCHTKVTNYLVPGGNWFNSASGFAFIVLFLKRFFVPKKSTILYAKERKPEVSGQDGPSNAFYDEFWNEKKELH